MDLSFIINVAGAALVAVVGTAVLLLSRGRGRGLLVGAMATSFGLTWVFQNLLQSHVTDRTLGVVGISFFAGLGTLSAIPLTHHLVQDASRTAKCWIASLGLFLAVAWITFIATVDLDGALVAVRWTILGVYGSFLFALILLLGALAVAFGSHPERKDLACLGLAFGPFVTFLWAAFAASAGFGDTRFGPIQDVLLLVLGGVTAAVIVPSMAGRQRPDLVSRMVFPTLAVAGAAGVVLVLLTGPDYIQDYGSFGVVRTTGAFFLVLAVVRYDILQIPLPSLAVRRGTLATAALAALLIVAEIAQNFFSAQYGLLMGGVIAGSLLFAANPIQRAIERRSAHAPPRAQHRNRSDPGDVYRAAVRAALGQSGISPAQEEHLAEVAEHLGLGPRDALRLRREAEGERRSG